jgi:hypothetical protein
MNQNLRQIRGAFRYLRRRLESRTLLGKSEELLLAAVKGEPGSEPREPRGKVSSVFTYEEAYSCGILLAGLNSWEPTCFQTWDEESYNSLRDCFRESQEEMSGPPDGWIGMAEFNPPSMFDFPFLVAANLPELDENPRKWEAQSKEELIRGKLLALFDKLARAEIRQLIKGARPWIEFLQEIDSLGEEPI